MDANRGVVMTRAPLQTVELLASSTHWATSRPRRRAYALANRSTLQRVRRLTSSTPRRRQCERYRSTHLRWWRIVEFLRPVSCHTAVTRARMRSRFCLDDDERSGMLQSVSAQGSRGTVGPPIFCAEHRCLPLLRADRRTPHSRDLGIVEGVGGQGPSHAVLDPPRLWLWQVGQCRLPHEA